MIEALEALDKRVAAGVITRAALALAGNPSSQVVVNGEEGLRAALLTEVRRRLDIDADDNRPETLEKVGEALDEESERLLGPTDTVAALKRLAERGDLPSDLYEISIIENISEFFGREFELERDLIEATIRQPSREQHYGRAQSAREPSLVSLFYREFSTPHPYKDFGMLVAAAREGLMLTVHQAWRIYQSAVHTQGASDLVGLLRRFSDTYGVEIDLDGVKGRFFFAADKPPPRNIHLDMRGKPGAISISQFNQKNVAAQGAPKAFLVMSTDLVRYRETLEKMKVKRAQIYQLAPRAAKVSAQQ
jgi:hypothetical protein